MATILTVHGTGTTGEETGEQWWQKGSEFEGRMRRLVEPNEGDTGELNFQPVIWDGANSETSRREAGTELCGKMNELEARGEPYSIIGHSHGGSVTSAALVNHAGKRCTLDYLKNWITVGTPFIQSRKERFLFTRLDVTGKLIYSILFGPILFIMLPLMAFLLLGPYFGTEAGDYGRGGEIAISFFSLVLAVPFLIYYYVSLKWERGKTLRYTHTGRNYLNKAYGMRYISLWHKNDEAVQGLSALKALRFDVFDKRFAVNAIRKSLSFILPFAIIGILVNSPSIMRAFHEFSYSYILGVSPVVQGDSQTSNQINNTLQGNGEDVNRNVNAVMEILLRTSRKIGCSVNFDRKNCYSRGNKVTTLVAAMMLMAIFFTMIWYTTRFLASPGSAVLALMLNATARSQIRATAFGSDAQVDEAVDARSWPMWMKTGQPPLPDELANEIQAHADKAAALAIPKFRNAARLFASTADGASSNETNSSDMLSEYLTWDELIHTSYFCNQRFCKLVAYALTQNGGLRASAAFKADPDYALVAKWHEGIVGTGVATTV